MTEPRRANPNPTDPIEPPIDAKPKPALLGTIRRQYPWLIVITILITGLVLIALDHWRLGSVIIGTSMLTAALFRTFNPTPGILSTRTRWLDLTLYYTLSLATITIALLVRPK